MSRVAQLAVAAAVYAIDRPYSYRVPEDISIVGFDNYLYPGLPDRNITTYEVNKKAMARAAIDKILKQIRNPKSGHGMSVISGNMIIKKTVRQKSE